jgi:hypothetical protein
MKLNLYQFHETSIHRRLRLRRNPLRMQFPTSDDAQMSLPRLPADFNHQDTKTPSFEFLCALVTWWFADCQTRDGHLRLRRATVGFDGTGFTQTSAIYAKVMNVD